METFVQKYPCNSLPTVLETDSNARVDVIDTQIKFLGDLDADQLGRLKDISEKCPVHRTLTSETVIRTELVP